MGFIEKLKKGLKKFYLQIIGAALIVASIVLTILNLIWVALGVLVFVGLYDLFLLYVLKKHSISQWIHQLFPKAIDAIIMVGLGVFTWWIFGPVGFLPVCIGLIAGHLFWEP